MNQRDTYRSQFAAYFAGQLSAEDAVRLEHALTRDTKLAREAQVLRPVARKIERDARSESADNFRLSPDRLAVIRSAAARHIVEFPGATRTQAVPARSKTFTMRRFAPALAAAMAVVISAIAGFGVGRESANGGSAAWRVASHAGSSASSTLEADSAYIYPPAYSLDRHVSWPSRGAFGFAASLPANFGLPGPRPAYLMEEESLLML